MNLQSFSKLILTVTLKDSEDACLKLFCMREQIIALVFMSCCHYCNKFCLAFFLNVLCNGILCVLFEENVLELKKRKMLEKSLNQEFFLKKSLPKYLLS